MLNKQAIYRALEVIEGDISEPQIVRNAVALIRCELAKEPASVAAEFLDRGAIRGRDKERDRIISICEDPDWIDGMAIADRIRSGE